MEIGTAPWWLPGGHAQTIWPALAGRARPGTARAVRFHRQRWELRDGDFVDADWLHPPCLEQAHHGRLIVLFHGLEGSSSSHYAQAWARWALAHQHNLVVPHFRGCSGEINRGPRAYHAGDHQEIEALLHEVAARDGAPRVAVGVSLGGNALLRWAQEQGHAASDRVCAVASVCAPLDLAVCGWGMGRGWNRWLYERGFLQTMKAKAVAKLHQHPGLLDAERIQRATSLAAFDDVFTAPLHGFQGVEDYWRRASALPGLASIRVPTLVVQTCNDPFVPMRGLPAAGRVSAGCPVEVVHLTHGGHVGLADGRWPNGRTRLPEVVMAGLAKRWGAE